jgi:hypothetical protein
MVDASNPPVSRVVDQNNDTRIVRKANDEIGYKVKSGHLALLSRKILNVLIWHAQEMRHEEDEHGRWSMAVAQLIKDARFNSRDYDLLRSALDELQEVRVVRPARGGGITSEVLIPSYTLDNVVHEGNEALQRGQKRRGGELRLWFMLPPELKKQLLDPDQYTRLPIAIMAALRTIPGLALYEICRRYVTNPGGITNRDNWQNWWRILTGATLDSDPPEYKYAKRDVFKRGVEEVNEVTDIEVELIEFKSGKFVRDIQFSVKAKQQRSLDMGPPPINTGLLPRITVLGLSISDAERISARHSDADIEATLALVEERMAHPTLTPIESPAAYFRKALKDKYATAKAQITDKRAADKAAREQKKLKDSTAQAAEADADQAARKEVLEAFMKLPEDEKARLLNEFVRERLKGPGLKAYNAQGLASPMVRGALTGWLVERRSI